MMKFTRHAIAAGILAIVATGASTAAHAGLVVTTMADAGGPDATGLVNTLLAGSSGITINSATYTGAGIASGTFSGGTGIIGFESGILLTSGDARLAVGPNNSTYATSDNGLGGSALLDTLIPGYSTRDATLLTIKFVPTSNFVKFSYVFSSEEYNEWVGSAYNDVFGFFVNGANFALLPGTTTPVSINNVNCGHSDNALDSNGNPIPTAAPGAGPNCNYYLDNFNGALDTQYDGLTRMLTFVAPVDLGLENTLVLGIADAGDWVLDSGVFLAGGTFTVCGGPGEPECEDHNNDAPEPGSLALIGLGLAGIAGLRRRRPSAGNASR